MVWTNDLPSTKPDDQPPAAKVALLWRGDPKLEPVKPETTRLALIFQALSDLGVATEPVIYADEIADMVRERLLTCDGVLVWVDPISDGKDRATLDPILREVARRRVWVSAHPDVILKMGVKEVLYRTRELGWGTDTALYSTVLELQENFPARLATAGPRVLKQNRGNGGLGVWKVELIAGTSHHASLDAPVTVLHARRGSAEETLTLGEFMTRCEAYFAKGGLIIDQAFQPRLPEGMIRCYMSGGAVAGFGQQLIKALIPPPPPGADIQAAEPGPRIMYPPDAPPFHALRSKMETDWVPAMQRLLKIDTHQLPALWDADFLYGPKTPAGDDTYVLCEINVSAITPYPQSAAPMVARAVLQALRAAREAR